MASQDDAPGMAQQAAEQAGQQMQEGAQAARGALRDQVDSRSTQAGQQVTQQASDVRSVADTLREQGKDGPAKIAEQAAERAERLGSYLERSDADTILHDVEDFARSNPWAVALGGLALGFAASRVLKASSQQRQGGGGQASTGTIGGQPREAFADREPATGRSVPAVQPASSPPVPAQPVGVGAAPADPRTGAGQWSS
jgi:hypothetical protein